MSIEGNNDVIINSKNKRLCRRESSVFRMITNFENNDSVAKLPPVSKLPSFSTSQQSSTALPTATNNQGLTKSTSTPNSDRQLTLYDKAPLINLSNLCSNLLNSSGNDISTDLNPCLHNDIKILKSMFGRYSVYNE